MTTEFIVAILIFTGIVIVHERLHRQQISKLNLEHKLEVAAIELGHLEIEESYENDFLTFNDHIALLNKTLETHNEDNAELTRQVVYHREFCLPVLEHIRTERETAEQVKAEMKKAPDTPHV